MRQRTELKFADETGLISISRKPEMNCESNPSTRIWSSRKPDVSGCGLLQLRVAPRTSLASGPALEHLRDGKSPSIFTAAKSPSRSRVEIPLQSCDRLSLSMFRNSTEPTNCESRWSMMPDNCWGNPQSRWWSISGEVRSRSQVWNRSRRRVGIVIHDPSTVFRHRPVDDVRGTEAIDWKHMLQSVRELGERESSDSLSIPSSWASIWMGRPYIPPTPFIPRLRGLIGTICRGSPDPVAKDLLELLFREFDQRRITWCPKSI